MAIDLVGGQHNEAEQVARDLRRDAFMAARGVQTLRYWNDEVMSRPEEVLADVWSVVDVLAKPESNGVANGDIFPPSSLQAPSPGGRREGTEPERFYTAPGLTAIWQLGS